MENKASPELERIKLIIRRSQRLTAPPQTVLKLISAIDREDSSAIELERIIISNPILAADFMRLGTTMGWSQNHSEASIRQLIVKMGFPTIRTIALSLMSRHMICSKELKVLDMVAFGQMSLVTAVLTRYFSARAKMASHSELEYSADELFAVGLISHMGLLLLASHAPDVYERCYHYAKRVGMTIDDAFKVICGSSLDALTEVLIEAWGLPEVFKTVISNMETPWKADENEDAIGCILAAKKVAADIGFKIEKWDASVEIPIEFADNFTITPFELESLSAHIQETMLLYFETSKAA